MILANYIKDLLYRYDCVIVPNFGGFITNRMSASYNTSTSNFLPPFKQIAFNNNLKENDGLLANYIASVESISFEDANKTIATAVNNWNVNLQNESLELKEVGVLSLNENQQIIFEPNTSVNYLAESFGLANVTTSEIERQKAILKPLVPVTNTDNKKVLPTLLKYAATAAILLTLGYVGNNLYQQNKQNTILAFQEKALEKKIQAATFTIANPLPTIELNVVKEVAKPFHIVAGAFQFPENANKKVNQLKKEGYQASIIGVNKWGLTEVVFSSFADRNDAINELYKIQDSVSKDAWLLVKK
jgi:hypothetical protein